MGVVLTLGTLLDGPDLEEKRPPSVLARLGGGRLFVREDGGEGFKGDLSGVALVA